MTQVKTNARNSRWKLSLSTVGLLCFLTGCASSSENKLVDQYLTLLQSGDTAGAMSLLCYPAHFDQSPVANAIISSYRIEPVSDTVKEAFPDGVPSLQDPSVLKRRVDIVINEEDSTRVLSIFTPDDHYKASQAEDAEWAAVGGEPVFGSDRANWSQAEECIVDRDIHARFKQVDPGQTKTEIEAILGSPGEQTSANTHVWKDPTSRSARQVTFQNGLSSIIQTVPY